LAQANNSRANTNQANNQRQPHSQPRRTES